MNTYEQDRVVEIVEKLDLLAKLREVIESFQQEQDELVDQAFLSSPDLAVRRSELNKTIEELSKKSAVDSKLLIEEVLRIEESVKGEKLQAVFSTGRTTWDTKALSGYVLAHPELEKLKKTGASSVSIREVKEKS